MRILVSGESRYLNTSSARRWVKYKGYRWTGEHGKSPIERDPYWRDPATMEFITFEYPEMTLIEIVAGNKFPVNIGKHQYTTLDYSMA